jgi:hypothetical protein
MADSHDRPRCLCPSHKGLRRKTDDCELYERGMENLKRIEAERVADKIAHEELARVMRDHAASKTSKQ